MADSLLLLALKSGSTKVNLNGKGLTEVPKIIGKLHSLKTFTCKGNQITDLPEEVQFLQELEVLNIALNEFSQLPEALRYLTNLKKLHLFQNRLKRLNGSILGSLQNLTFLNINSNGIIALPEEIGSLLHLQFLSADNNKLVTLPDEFCFLSELKELHLANNRIAQLPHEIGYLTRLEKLYLQKNRLKEIPESFGRLDQLRIFDIAANDLRIFPSELPKLRLDELYCEQNSLIPLQPVESVQEEEVLALKELCVRYLAAELKNRWSPMRRKLLRYPTIREMLSQCGRCSRCGGAFLNTWLECIRYSDAKRDLSIAIAPGIIPIRVLLCSYKCFNERGSEPYTLYGIGFGQ